MVSQRAVNSSTSFGPTPGTAFKACWNSSRGSTTSARAMLSSTEPSTMKANGPKTSEASSSHPTITHARRPCARQSSR